ncbi:hypothetical protein KUCAC02_030400 [Chaenocephalus aceratus]|uniref:Uncharacterized protein n=1 Tax=Chaenocephalus aceratus TaxID=36190 RepID=A0ACB9XL02_CHAAC|nr:hypothetical protein KUCAC02_030400 [Chaenocephalus aceratus]
MDGQRDGGSEVWELAVDQQSRFRLSGEDTEQATGATAPQQRGRHAGSELAMRFPNSFEDGDSAWLKPSVTQPPRDNHTDESPAL